jgi:hypothetical protein
MRMIWIILGLVAIAAIVYANYTGYLTFGYTPAAQTPATIPASAGVAWGSGA